MLEFESVRIGKCQNGKVSEFESATIKKCQNWKMSELESIRISKNKKVSEFQGWRHMTIRFGEGKSPKPIMSECRFQPKLKSVRIGKCQEMKRVRRDENWKVP